MKRPATLIQIYFHFVDDFVCEGQVGKARCLYVCRRLNHCQLCLCLSAALLASRTYLHCKLSGSIAGIAAAAPHDQTAFMS